MLVNVCQRRFLGGAVGVLAAGFFAILWLDRLAGLRGELRSVVADRVDLDEAGEALYVRVLGVGGGVRLERLEGGVLGCSGQAIGNDAGPLREHPAHMQQFQLTRTTSHVTRKESPQPSSARPRVVKLHVKNLGCVAGLAQNGMSGLGGARRGAQSAAQMAELIATETQAIRQYSTYALQGGQKSH